MTNRTSVDFSQHVLEIIKNEHVLIHDLKLSDKEYHHRVKFINTCGVMVVTGDFGNWIFCREFHPSSENGVSDYYWVEKIQMHSEQNLYDFDNEETEKEIREGLERGLEEYGYEDEHLEKMKEYYTELLDYVHLNEWEYTAFAYNNMPSFLDAESVPFVKSIKQYLLIIFDAFDEICNRMKIEEENI